MSEATSSNFQIFEEQPARPVRTLEALIRLYGEGHRNFSGSDLRGVTVDVLDKEIKYLDLREIILRGSNLSAIYLGRNGLIVNLTGSDLSHCNLQGANLYGCRLNQCNLNHSNLRKAILSTASCRGADFVETILISAVLNTVDFTAANLTKSNLSSATLSGCLFHANFFGSNLKNVDFAPSNSQGADFSNADLRGLKPAYRVEMKYSYYNQNTKFSDDFDPIERGMELLEDQDEMEAESEC